VAAGALFQLWVLAGFFALAGVAVCLFFRDPERQPPPDPSLLVSPADGRVLFAGESGGRLKISIFMSVFNVHVNRAPCPGEVLALRYNPGKFMAAYADKASLDNEQNRILLRTGRGEMEVVQIAGLVARRIVCWARFGRTFLRGERIGLIRFGSRVDLYLPQTEVEVLVRPGEKTRAGVTPVARWRALP